MLLRYLVAEHDIHNNYYSCLSHCRQYLAYILWSLLCFLYIFFQTNNGGIELVTFDHINIKYILVMFIFYLVAKI